MDTFIVSARKYRPTTFQEVVGQSQVTQTLQNALANNKVAQAFLFCGPRGVGKTTCARILAKVINTETNAETADNDFAFNIFELDAASNNSVDDIRVLTEQVRIPPQVGKYKVYIIDEVHMLSQAAFNAFLKTLEEPPAHAIFILATTEKHKIIPTILSRCQIFDFNRITVDDIVSHLNEICQKESIEFDKEGLHIIAQKADGALRDSLSLFDKIVSATGKKVALKDVLENLNILDYEYFFKMTYALLEQNQSEVLLLFDQILTKGFEPQQLSHGMCHHFRDLLVAKEENTLQLLEKSEQLELRYKEQAQLLSKAYLISGLDILNSCNIELRTSKSRRLQMELTLLKLCYLSNAIDLSTNKAAATAQPAVIEKKTLVAKPTPKDAPIVNHGATLPPIETKVEVKPPIKTSETIENVVAEKKPEPFRTNLAPEHLSIGAGLNLPISNSQKKSFQTPTENGVEEIDESVSWNTDEFKQIWANYLTELQTKNQHSLYEALKHSKPLLSGNSVTVVFPTQVLLDSFKNSAEHCKEYLVEHASLSSVVLLTKLDKSSNVKVNEVPYTAKEKYAEMVKENPLLEEFRQKFNLSLNY